MDSLYSSNYQYCDIQPEKPVKLKTGVKKIQKLISKNLNRWIMEDYYGYPQKAPRSFSVHLRKWILLPAVLHQRLRRKDVFPYIGEGKLLDVGCGMGDNMARFREYGWDVYGLDISEAAVKNARRRIGNHVFQGDLLSVGFDAASFDLIHFRHTLEHMHDPVAVLREAHRILKDGGLMVVLLPNIGSWEARIFSKWWTALELPWHLYHFDPSTLQAVLAKSGLRCVRSRTSVGSGSFMTSLETVIQGRWGQKVFMKKLVDRLVARPFSFAAGYLGYGSEIEVYARKSSHSLAEITTERTV